MKRKDIIIISVLVNAGLLALLFITAVKSEPELSFPTDQVTELAKAEEHLLSSGLTMGEQKEGESDLFLSGPVVDEVDHVLKEYLPEISFESTAAQTERTASAPAEAVTVEAPAVIATTDSAAPKETIVEVRVKSGDALEKIARANHTTVEAIRKANHLTSDKLKIGQVLKIPVGSAKSKDKIQTKNAIASENKEMVYYTIKNGDNPWKIAKAYHVKFEDLLKLNNLNEEKAKNLKAGDQIRVK